MDAPRQVQEVSHRIVESGAVMAVGGSPATYSLVGALRWSRGGRLLWFAAHGDSEHDAHVLEFDRVQAVDRLGICFIKEGYLAGYLSPIATAQVEDPDDYQIGWRIWKDVAPLYETLIERAFDRIEDGSRAARGSQRVRSHSASTVAA